MKQTNSTLEEDPSLKKQKKNISIGYNSEIFSDFTLVISPSNNSNSTTSLRVCKLVLAAESTYFEALFSNWTDSKKEDVIILDEGDDVNYFLDVIRCIYKMDMETPTESLMNVLRYADKYSVELAVNTVSERLLCEELSLTDACTILKLPDTLKNYTSIQNLIENAENFVVKSFTDLKDEMKTDDFLSLPLEALLTILMSDDICIDSENTILFAMILWINHCPEKRQQLMEHLLPHVRFPQMKLYFLLDVIPYQAVLYPTVSGTIMKMYREALEYKSGGSQRTLRMTSEDPEQQSQFRSRKISSQDTITILHEFKNVSKWKLNEVHKSPLVYSNGYQFCFYLESCTNPKDQSDALGIDYGCESILLPERFYIPIEGEVFVRTNEKDQRFFGKRIIDSSKSGAFYVEKWQDLVSGKSKFVINDTISFKVEMKLLENDNGIKI